jgi:hypothetical protein
MNEATCLEMKSMMPYTNSTAKKIDRSIAAALGTLHRIMNTSNGLNNIENKNAKANGSKIPCP